MRLTRLVAAAATAAALVLAPAATASAAPGFAPTQGILTFSVPTTGGTAPITVTAQQAPSILIYPPPPPALTYTVSNPAAASPAWEHIYIVVSWRNLISGKTGDVTLRPWQSPGPQPRGYVADLPVARTAPTGSGAIVATVTVLREQSGRQPAVISVIPGLNASLV